VPLTGSPCPLRNTPIVLEPVKLVTRNSFSPGITTTFALGTQSRSATSICVTGRTSVRETSARSIRLYVFVEGMAAHREVEKMAAAVGPEGRGISCGQQHGRSRAHLDGYHARSNAIDSKTLTSDYDDSHVCRSFFVPWSCPV
jgi:hypothetical protein